MSKVSKIMLFLTEGPSLATHSMHQRCLLKVQDETLGWGDFAFFRFCQSCTSRSLPINLSSLTIGNTSYYKQCPTNLVPKDVVVESNAPPRLGALRWLLHQVEGILFQNFKRRTQHQQASVAVCLGGEEGKNGNDGKVI